LQPLASINNTAICPCGLIANSIFNGQSQRFAAVVITHRLNQTHSPFSTLTLLNPSDTSQPSLSYTISSKGIAWPGEAKKYATTSVGLVAIQAFPISFPLIGVCGTPTDTQINPPPNLKDDEHFQNRMRLAYLSKVIWKG